MITAAATVAASTSGLQIEDTPKTLLAQTKFYAFPDDIDPCAFGYSYDCLE